MFFFEQVFQLCQDDRHVIFSGDMFKWDGQQWIKIYIVLFTDILLQTRKETDGYLRVLHEPMMLADIAGVDATRKHGTYRHIIAIVIVSHRASKAKFLSVKL